MLDLNDQEFNRFGNVGTLQELSRHIKENHIIPFVGAGMSIDIYGSWGSSLEHIMAGYYHNSQESTEVMKQIAGGHFEQAAERIKTKLRDTPFWDRLVEVFSENLITDDALLKMSVRFLPELFPTSLVITTNFDKVLERAFRKDQKDFTEKVTLRHLSEWQAENVRKNKLHYLIKIHGCVSAPDEVVMTKKSYEELYTDGSVSIERLRGILRGNNLLFIGCGLNEDRTVKLLGERDLRGHYAILEMNGKANDDVFEQRRQFMCDKLGMHCIWYPQGEHHYVSDILEYIYFDYTDQLKVTDSAAPLVSSVGRNHLPSEAPKPTVNPLIKGETTTIGRWNGKPLEWLILDVQPGKTLLITKDCLMKAPYHKELIGITWNACTLRKELLPQLLEQIFAVAERKRVLLKENVNPKNEQYDTRGGADTEDTLFLLSIDEAKQYFPYDGARVAELNCDAWWWWLRSPGIIANRAAGVDFGGSLHTRGSHVSNAEGGVRPALWLNLQS
ncbi:MAG: SIR2 family protein [Oscillospiraceae bacterium]|nr:SIR2 family protein [Oscillospiraceae bacterium]